ncbi:MAG TPA: ATP-binding protein, partial [Solirubrobacteraceae bacterium]|nr:ATP-binding protein [Solirubrobacteraceae bacterium]
AVALSLAASTPPAVRARTALLNALIILVPVGVGLYARRLEAQRRFGGLLIAAGFLWSTTSLAQADGSLPYSVGRLGGWAVTLVAVLLVLGYPDGRLGTASARWLGAAAALCFAVLYMPTALLVHDFPAHSPWAACAADCPPNAFMVLDRQPEFLDAWFIPLRETLTVVLALGALGEIASRAGRAGTLRRRAVVPVVVAAAALMIALAAFVVARRTDAGTQAIEMLGWIYGLSIPALGIGLLIGLARRQWYVATALERLTALLGQEIPAGALRDRLAEALGDPSLRLVRPSGRGWIDDAGRIVAAPAPGGPRVLTPIGHPTRPTAALVHDAAFADDPAFMAAVRSCVQTALERTRRSADADKHLRELDRARARLLADADRERRRIERDLHDGAQQRLVALRIKLGLACDPDVVHTKADAAFLERIGSEVDEIIDEIRALARGVYPSLLADRGLPDALTSAALRMPLPTRIDADGIGRYDPAVEASVYFTCLEALQNVAKHATGATGIWVTLRAGDGSLTFEVRDDGAGFPDVPAPGAGLAHMRDRLAAVGGELRVESAPGSGTRLTGMVLGMSRRPAGETSPPAPLGQRPT